MAAKPPDPVSHDDHDDKASSQPTFQWSGTGQEPLDDAESSADEADIGNSTKTFPPVQKRRRVTRACDECRRKKIKCDGKQPCTHCTVYSYDCTYDQPSNRRRNPAPQYIEAIEGRLHRAEALLKHYHPDIDLTDPNLIPPLPPGMHLPSRQTKEPENTAEIIGDSPPDGDAMLESMVKNTGCLDLDDQGHWDYHGHSSGMVFLQKLKEQFGDRLESEDHGHVFARARHHPPLIFDSPRSGDSPMDSGPASSGDLPPKAAGRLLCEVALDDAMALMRFIHQPTFYAIFDRIYDTPHSDWTDEEHKHLPLLYSVMALGSMFAKSDNSKLTLEGYETSIEVGFKYFRAARQLMDLMDCQDLPQLQAIICMVLFLQTSAKLSTCYVYIGTCLHSAVKMGLHRSVAKKFNPIEAEIRKRVFWQIWKMNVFVGVMLGMPMMLDEEDIDQELPLDIDDEHILVDKILPMPKDKIPIMAASNAHTKLTKILQKIVKYIYPIKGVIQDASTTKSFSVSHAKVREIERDLQQWMENLPMKLRPGGESSPELTRVQQLLRIGYAYLQLFLYRPFVHYVSKTNRHLHNNKRSYACAAASISVSRNIVHITSEMSRRGLLIGGYWFVMYTNFIATVTLVYFVLENPDNSSSQDILKDAMQGKDMLTSLARKSMAADRSAQTLTSMFAQLPERLLKGGVQKASSIKRKHAASPMPNLDGGSHSTPNVNAAVKIEPGVQRASTFPNNPSLSTWKRSSHAHSQDTTRRSSHDTYTPPSVSRGTITPESQSSGSNAYSHQVPFSSSSASPLMPSNSAFADLGRIMFPSDNPFEYPTQPMTTLENHAQHDQSNPNPMRRPYLGQFSPTQQGQAASTQSHQFDPSLDEVQLYALPPYFIQGQQGVPGFGAEFQSDSMDVSGPSAGDMMGMWSGPEPEGDWAGEAKHWNFPPGYGQ